MDGGFNIQVVIQLWQVVIGIIISCLTLLGLGFTAATVFVKRSDCRQKHELSSCGINKDFKEIKDTQQKQFDLLREVSASVDFLRGMVTNK